MRRSRSHPPRSPRLAGSWTGSALDGARHQVVLSDGVAIEVRREERVELRTERGQLGRLLLERRDELHDWPERLFHPLSVELRAERGEEHHVAIEHDVGD